MPDVFKVEVLELRVYLLSNDFRTKGLSSFKFEESVIDNILLPEPSTLTSQPSTLNPQPSTLHTQP